MDTIYRRAQRRAFLYGESLNHARFNREYRETLTKLRECKIRVSSESDTYRFILHTIDSDKVMLSYLQEHIATSLGITYTTIVNGKIYRYQEAGKDFDIHMSNSVSRLSYSISRLCLTIRGDWARKVPLLQQVLSRSLSEKPS